MSLLDYIQREALSTVLDAMETHPRDLAVQAEGRRVLLFFFEAEEDELL